MNDTDIYGSARYGFSPPPNFGWGPAFAGRVELFVCVEGVMTSHTAKWEAMKRADGHCEDCGDPLVEGEYHAHHKTYERKGKEKPEDLEILCLDCHGERHPHHEFVPKSEQRERARENRKRRGKRGTPRWKKVRCQECGRWVAPGKGFRMHVISQHPEKSDRLNEPPRWEELEHERRERERNRARRLMGLE